LACLKSVASSLPSASTYSNSGCRPRKRSWLSCRSPRRERRAAATYFTLLSSKTLSRVGKVEAWREEGKEGGSTPVA